MKNKQLFLFIFSFLCFAINATQAGEAQTAEEILQRGIEHLHQDQFDQARECLNYIVQDSNYTAPALTFLGISYQNQYYKFSHDINHVLSAYKYYCDALCTICMTNKYPELLVSICRNKAYILLDMAEQQQLELLGLTKEEALTYAYQYLNICLNKTNNGEPRALFLHGCIYLAQFQADQAWPYFEQAANLDYYPALHNLACIHLLKAEYGQALEKFNSLAQRSFKPSQKALKLLTQEAVAGKLADGRFALTPKEIAYLSALPASKMI